MTKLIARRAEVDGELHFAGDDIDRSRLRLDAADRADELGIGLRDALDGEHALGRRRERVAPQVHRHRAGVAGLALQRDAQAREAVDGGDDADWQAFGFKHRSLLDVQLGIGHYRALFARHGADAGGVKAEGEQRLFDADSGSVGGFQHCRIERAGDRPAAEHRGSEAHALFVAEADHLDGEWQPLAPFVERRHAFDGAHHAEHAVVAAGVAYRVEMRPEHQAGLLLSFVAPDDVADRIHARLHAGFAHPAEHQLVRRAVLAREEHARQSARKLRMARKRVAALHDAFGGQHGRIVYFVRDARRAEPPGRRRVRQRARRRVRAFAVGGKPRL